MPGDAEVPAPVPEEAMAGIRWRKGYLKRGELQGQDDCGGQKLLTVRQMVKQRVQRWDPCSSRVTKSKGQVSQNEKTTRKLEKFEAPRIRTGKLNKLYQIVRNCPNDYLSPWG